VTATEQASKGRTALIPLLLEHGARAGARDSLGSTPLHRAAAAGKVRVNMAPPWPTAKGCRRLGAGMWCICQQPQVAHIAAVALQRRAACTMLQLLILLAAGGGHEGAAR
jgi:Ankyrin repeats (many copies)